jgi:bifunctional non-homologous end joining protein LigD
MVPLQGGISHDDARQSSKLVAEAFAERDRRYITRSAPSLRPGHIFIDYLRNGRGTTAVGTWSPRARAGFPVSMPVTWDDVEAGTKADAYRMESFV